MSSDHGSRIGWVSAVSIVALATIVLLLRIDIPDGAEFGGDTWEYQAMAVNFAAGHGLKNGEILDYDAYRFDPDIDPRYLPTLDHFRNLGREGGSYDLYREPAYPILLGLFYRVAGVRPDDAMLIQMLVLVAIGGLTPLLGERLLGRKGLLAGIPAGLLFALFVAPRGLSIMTETMISLTCCGILWAWLLAERRRDWLSGIALGLSLALALLVKGNLIFVPLLLLGYLAIRCLSGAYPRSMILSAVIATAIPPLAYSAWASAAAGKWVFVTTHAQEVMLDAHNEYTLLWGIWAPHWREDPSSFYSRARAANPSAGTFELISDFYLSNPELFPRMVLKKLEALSTAPSIIDSIAMNGLMSVLFVFLCFHAARRRSLPISGLLGLFAGGIVAALSNADLVVCLAGAVLAFLFGLSSREFVEGARRSWRHGPTAALSLFLFNFLLISVAVFADHRFIWPAYFAVFLLSGFLLLGLAEAIGLARWPEPRSRNSDGTGG